MPLFGLGESKKGAGGFPFSSEMVERLTQISQPIQAAIKKLTEKEGGENIDPLLPKQLTAEAVKLVEKYASDVLQTLLQIEAQLVNQLETSIKSAEQDDRDLKKQINILKTSETIGKTRIDNLRKEAIQIKENSLLEKQNEILRLNQIGITNKELEENKTIVAELANEYLGIIESNATLNKQLSEANLLAEMNQELITSKERIDTLK